MTKKSIVKGKSAEIPEISSKEYKSLLDIAEVMFFVFDVDGMISLANKKAETLLECGQEELVGKNWFDNFIPRPLIKEVIETSKKIFSGEELIVANYKSTVVTFTGNEKVVYWSNSIIKNSEGKITGILSTGIDGTQIENNNKKNLQLSVAVEQSSNTVVITDVKGNIEYTNPKFTQVTGYTAEEALGQNPRILNAGILDDSVYEEMWASLTKGQPWNGEFCNKSKTGKLFWEKVVISPIFGENGALISYLAIKEDVTHQKNIEEKLKEKLEEIEIINANTPVIIWKTEMNEKGEFTNPYISDAVDDFLSLPVGSINNDFSKFYEFVDSKYMPEIYAVLRKGFENPGVSYNVEYQVEKANGERAWFSSFGAGKITPQNKKIVYGSTVDITNQRKVELNLIDAKEKAEENEVKFKAISNQSTEGINLVDVEGNYVYVNPAFCKMTGYSEVELLKLSVLDMRVNNETNNIFYNNKEKLEGIPTRVNLRKKNGKKYITEITRKVIHLNNQEFALGTIRDITQRVIFEESLIESEKFLLESQSVARIGSYVLDITNGEWKSSPVLNQIFGIDSDYVKDVAGWIDIIHPLDKENLTSYFNSNILINHEFFDREYRIRSKDSQEMRWVHGMGKLEFAKNGALIKMTGTIQDITKRKIEERELLEAKIIAEENEVRFKALHNASFGGIAIHDNGQIMDCNLGLSEITGYELKELIGMDGLLLISESTRDLVRSNIELNYEEPYEVLGLRKNGEEYYLRLAAKKIPYHGKEARVVEFRDVTEQKLTESELVFAKLKAEESDLLKTEFINNMSHEIRTPLNAILGFTDFLTQPELTTIQREKYTDIIQKSGTQLLRIVDDVMEISRLGTQQVEIKNTLVSLNEICKSQFDVFEPLAKERNLQLILNTELSMVDIFVEVDANMLSKILSNLLENALKFTNEGFIEFGFSKQTGVFEKIEFFVKDSGVGISEENQESIFIRFSQEEKELNKKVGGLGLGLSIASESAKLMGGEITVQSKKGSGATFFVTLPYKQPDLTEEYDSNTIQNKQMVKTQVNYTILVVDDEKINLMYLSMLLNELNCHILEAVNGKEAVDICIKHPEIDLVFMDLKMPIMSGFDAAKLIKERRPQLPIIAQTAYSTMEEETEALNSGCDDFISKPLGKTEVFEKVSKFLSK